MDEIMKMFQKQILDSIDKEIRSTILGTTGFEEESDYSVNNAINAIERAQAIITDVIICNETTKKQFDGMDIPKTVEIISQNYLKDGEIYMVLDDDIKFALLKCNKKRMQKASD
ncbi:hypothetical protein [Bacteroides acidifaciens]|uniref:hypothetical protein n=1 Tax=Bacteroides acidifaciens TaxID=85831 RepID=UPI00248C5372|nr:hypothetical protein [Bacteroides acidifaciens]